MQCALGAHSGQARCASHDVAQSTAVAQIAHMAKVESHPRHFLRSWRKFRGYTLEGVAERVGMSHQNLGKIERGRVPYNETLLDILADIYMTDRGSLIMRDPLRPDPLWSIYDRLPQPERVKLVERLGDELKLKKAG